jgi:MOSC domain-containing protein YiiM
MDKLERLHMKVQALYAGKAQILEPSGDRTGIFKMRITRAKVGRLGIEGDVQVDKRYHGGPDKALHQFAIGSYRRIVEQFPDLADKAIPGSIGENLSVADMDEYSVCIGDIYRLGKVLVQVSEPRQPCWKINAKYGVEQLTEYIDQEGMAGWYYRVLEAGEVRIGDQVTLLERPNETITIDHFNQIKGQQRPDPDALASLINAEGLAVSLKERLQAR